MEEMQKDVMTKITMKFLEEIDENNLSDFDVMAILAQTTRLVTHAIEQIEGKEAAHAAFLMFHKMYHISGIAVSKIKVNNKGERRYN